MLRVYLFQEPPEVGLGMGWHSSKEELPLLHLLNGCSTLNHLLQKGPSLVLLWDSGEVFPTQLAHLSSDPSFLPRSFSPSRHRSVHLDGFGQERPGGSEEAHFWNISYLAQDGMRTGATLGPPLAGLGQLDSRLDYHTGLDSWHQMTQPQASGGRSGLSLWDRKLPLVTLSESVTIFLLYSLGPALALVCCMALGKAMSSLGLVGHFQTRSLPGS